MYIFQCHKFYRSILSLAVVFSILLSPTQANALSPVQKQVLDSGVNYFNTERTVACGGGGSVNLVGTDNIKNAYAYFVQRGLQPHQSAAIVGNLQAESGVDPTAEEGAPNGNTLRPGFGIAQWTDTRDGGRRRSQIETFARDNGKVLTDLVFQLDYLYDQELTKGYNNSVFLPIQASTTLRQASDIFLHKFEVPTNASAQEASRAALGQKVLELYGNGATGGPVTGGTTSCGAVGAGFTGFPLTTTKAIMADQNGGCITKGPAMCRGGHPYAAYDINAPVGTPVVSLFDGEVISVSEDKCPGRLISIYSEAQGVTLSYLHLSIAQTKVTEGQTVTAGQEIGIVGTLREGCVIPHLHIDAALGDSRPGCRRENCPLANQQIFTAGEAKISLGVSLHQNYLKLP